MYTGTSIGIALDASGLIILALALLAMLHSQYNNKHWTPHFSQFFLSAMLHFAALSMKITAGVHRIYRRGTLNLASSYGIAALAFDAVSVILFILYTLSDEDGHLRLDKRKIPISGLTILGAVIPNLIALGLELMVDGITFLGISYAISLHLAYMILNTRTERDLEEREETLSIRQAKLLTEQIQPHFIFNSLSSIEALCMIDPMAAAKSVEDFSGYLRGNIDALTSEAPIPFRTELSHIEQYILLEKADPARQFTVEYDLKAEDFLIPALTVQPIVENAVKHGALSRTDGSGVIRISTEDIGGFVRISVEDNGVNALGGKKSSSHRSTGIQNVKTRLAAQCGGRLDITQKETGTKAIFMIPKSGGKNVHTDRR